MLSHAASASVLTLLLAVLVPVFSSAQVFSYDPSAPNGPANWASLPIPNNACGGSAQSGVDIPIRSCDETNADYKFEVRVIDIA